VLQKAIALGSLHIVVRNIFLKVNECVE